MSETTLRDETRDKLMKVSSATLCTALFKQGLRNLFLPSGLRALQILLGFGRLFVGTEHE